MISMIMLFQRSFQLEQLDSKEIEDNSQNQIEALPGGQQRNLYDSLRRTQIPLILNPLYRAQGHFIQSTASHPPSTG